MHVVIKWRTCFIYKNRDRRSSSFPRISCKLRKGFAVSSLFQRGYIIALDGKHHTVALSDGTAEDVLSLWFEMSPMRNLDQWLVKGCICPVLLRIWSVGTQTEFWVQFLQQWAAPSEVDQLSLVMLLLLPWRNICMCTLLEFVLFLYFVFNAVLMYSCWNELREKTETVR